MTCVSLGSQNKHVVFLCLLKMLHTLFIVQVRLLCILQSLKSVVGTDTCTHIPTPTVSTPILWKGFLLNKKHGNIENCASNIFF